MFKFTISALLIAATSASAALIKEGFYVKKSPSLVKMIQDHPELVLDHMSSAGFELYGPSGTKEWLESVNADFQALPDQQDEKSKAFADYPTFEQITKRLFALQERYPNIMKVFSIGKSVQGRDLWMVKISDNVNTDEVEPEFKYISSMHGDEIVGRELTQFWIKDMVEGYGKNSEITNLINNTEIYVMPSMNPDGSKKRVRANAHYTDLNRNFPDWTVDEANSSRGREIETKAIMDFQAKRQFALSANFHGGAVVVNYPWDSTYERHPFDNLIKNFSLDYANLNPGMRNSGEFRDGVTNGADWYKVVGGMQDWSYVWHNDLQVTIELSNKKWPSYREIPAFYDDNKESMTVFAKAIHQGAGFSFSDKSVEGRVSISKLENGNMTDLGSYGFRGGEFYKVLEEGVYSFAVSANGETQNFEMEVSKDKMADNGNYKSL